MTSKEIPFYRLINQQIAGTKLKTPAQLVLWMGGIQAQEFGQSKYAIGVRLPNVTDADVEEALAKRSIIRTWLMRGTLHFVSPTDIHWMLKLLTPRLINSIKGRYKRLELNESILKKTNAIIERSLQGNKYLTRDELAALLKRSKINAKGIRLAHILQRANFDGLICLGARRGNQFTYTLLGGAPSDNFMKRDEAVAELAKRYFLSHGPATIPDFAYWAGLTLAEAKIGLESVKTLFKEVEINKTRYWLSKKLSDNTIKPAPVYLLPGFDEYFLGYKDKILYLPKMHAHHVMTVNGIFHPVIVINGQISGSWRRTFVKDKVVIELKPFVSISKVNKKVINSELERFGKFLDKKVVIDSDFLLA